MMDFFVSGYLWLKAFHVIFCIAWMAGLFYLPRLFVYQCQTETGSVEYRLFLTMERKLLTIIMAPAAIGTWIFGLIIAFAMGYWTEIWFLSKMACAVLMTLVHLYDIHMARQFTNGTNTKSERFFRFWNEAPTLLMFAIVILAIVKPA